MKTFSVSFLVLFCLILTSRAAIKVIAKNYRSGESHHGDEHHHEEAVESIKAILVSIGDSNPNKTYLTYDDINTFARNINPNRTCDNPCPTCTTASYVFNTLGLTNKSIAIDDEIFSTNASSVLVFTLTHHGWDRVCNSTINANPSGVKYHLHELYHDFGNETAKGFQENGINKLLLNINQTYGISHGNDGRKCFSAHQIVEESHSNHSHENENHGGYFKLPKVMPGILKNLALGYCINATLAAKPEDHFAEILEAINAKSKVVMTFNDLNTLSNKINPNRTCSNCIGCSTASFVYGSMHLGNTQTLNKTTFSVAAKTFTYTLLPKGWSNVCNFSAQGSILNPEEYLHHLLHDFGNETRHEFSLAGVAKMLHEINETYGLFHPQDGRKCFSAATIFSISNDPHSGHNHRRRRESDDHNHGSAATTTASKFLKASMVLVPIIENLAKGHCIEETDLSHDDHHDESLPEKEFFVKNMFELYASSGRVNLTSMQNLMTKLGIGKVNSNSTSNNDDDHSGHNHKRHAVEKRAVDTDHDHKFEGQCYSASQIFTIYSVGSMGANKTQFTTLSPALVQQIATNACKNTTTTNTTANHIPTDAEVWGYSMLAVTVNTVASVAGILFIPCLKKEIFHYVICTLIGLAVGALTGDAILHLIPHAITEHSHAVTSNGLTVERERLLKMLVCLGGLYVFYVFENAMVLLSRKSEEKRVSTTEQQKANAKQVKFHGNTEKEAVNAHSNPELEINEKNVKYSKDQENAENANNYEAIELKTEVNQNSTNLNNDADLELATPANRRDSYKITIEKSKSTDEDVVADSGNNIVCIGLTAIGMMVVVGDGFHNFTDGIAIAAAFKSSLPLGLGTAIAVFCHELPQELGDFAILYASGIPVMKALLFNLLSAMVSYLGVVVGVFAGSSEVARHYLFALTGGLFLYIGLVDIMPQMTNANHGSKSPSGGHSHAVEIGEMNWKKFLCQNLGLLIGFTIMFLLAYFEDQITVG